MRTEKHIVVSEETHKAIRRAAFMADMSMRDFIAKLIKDYNEALQSKNETTK